MKFPVSEKELERGYGEIMPEIERVNQIWESWPEIVRCAGSWECLRDIHAIIFGGASWGGRGNKDGQYLKGRFQIR